MRNAVRQRMNGLTVSSETRGFEIAQRMYAMRTQRPPQRVRTLGAMVGGITLSMSQFQYPFRKTVVMQLSTPEYL